MKQILVGTMLLNDIKKLSSEDQTSCLEGFHPTSKDDKLLMAWHILQVGLCHVQEDKINRGHLEVDVSTKI